MYAKGGLALKKVLDALDKWGYYLLALLCAAAILLSAVWAARSNDRTPPDLSAAADRSERLSDVRYSEDTAASAEAARPCEGEILRPFSADATYFAAISTWRTHEAVDFACGVDGDVRAARAGRVTRAGDGEIAIDHGGGLSSVYRGIGTALVEAGASVAAGDPVARGGTPLHGGASGVCVTVYADGLPVDFFERFRIEKD